MADRGRDLKFNLLSDISKFDTDRPAKGLEDLADSADLAGKAVDKLSDIADRSDLDKIDRDAKDGGRSLEDFERQARETASRVDDAFDKIAKSSRQNLHTKLDDNADNAKRSMREVSDEARDTGREMAASFTGSSDDIMGALQELGANAGVAFGPIGGALSIALGSGLGLFFADWQKKKEKLTEDVQTFTDALIEGQGRLSEEFLNQQISGIDPKKIKELGDAAREAQVPVRDVIRAYAGDPEALDRTTKLIDARTKAIDTNVHRTTESEAATLDQANALKSLSSELDITGQALGQSKTAFELMRDAMSDPVVPKVDGSEAISDADNTRARVEAALSKKVKIPLGVDGSSIDRETRLAWQRADSYFRRNPITLRTKAGARPIRDVP